MKKAAQYVVKSVAGLKDISRRCELAAFVLKDQEKALYVSHLFGAELNTDLNDKMAFLAFSDLDLMKNFIQKHLSANLKMEVNPKLTIGRYFARLAFRHDFCIKPVLALIQAMDRQLGSIKSQNI